MKRIKRRNKPVSFVFRVCLLNNGNETPVFTIFTNKQLIMDKSDKKETKYPLKLYLRIRPQRNGKQELLDFYKPKDEKEMHINVPNDSIV